MTINDLCGDGHLDKTKQGRHSGCRNKNKDFIRQHNWQLTFVRERGFCTSYQINIARNIQGEPPLQPRAERPSWDPGSPQVVLGPWNAEPRQEEIMSVGSTQEEAWHMYFRATQLFCQSLEGAKYQPLYVLKLIGSRSGM